MASNNADNRVVFLSFLRDMDNSINQICNLLCEGCEIDDPSQLHHQCLMMSQIEKIEQYTKRAVEALPRETLVKILTAVTEAYLVTNAVGKNTTARDYPEYMLEFNRSTPADENGVSSSTQ
ncbi:hypothetical protein BaRGS_00018741 [Batillaria attramentaria]|uniref:Uncharacterized protein n=1 Tax=Batillaria attramentaria TaxID=370345 RepID=A0ABD0KQT0_9CAEN